uniref:Uncharacterized protein n=1 Tax=viral metagenome TaxID=1070528 RepID=A0A6C0LMT5_9ZZZZ
MPGIGYFSAVSGSGGQASRYVIDPKNSGKAINGYMPQQNQTVDKKYANFEQVRFALKNAWNTDYPRQLRRNNLKRSITTPFRAVNNAGDLLGRLDYSCGGPCQTFQHRPGLYGLRKNFGSVSNSCTPSVAYNSLQLNRNIPAAACNTKYVYDSSDYVKFLKQSATAKNYNDLSYGGDDSNSSQVAQKAIRRF